jgi:LEA14-like dessication related protein
MTTTKHFLLALVLAASMLAGCAAMPGHEPLQVNVADVQSIDGEGLEFRMLVKLRVQNPNDSPVDYDGVYLRMDVLDKTFATGVSDERGTIPRFGEALVTVPVTVSTLNIVRHTLAIAMGGAVPDKIRYRLEGKLNGPAFGSTRFESQGEFAMQGAAQ